VHYVPLQLRLLYYFVYSKSARLWWFLTLVNVIGVDVMTFYWFVVTVCESEKVELCFPFQSMTSVCLHRPVCITQETPRGGGLDLFSNRKLYTGWWCILFNYCLNFEILKNSESTESGRFFSCNISSSSRWYHVLCLVIRVYIASLISLSLIVFCCAVFKETVFTISMSILRQSFQVFGQATNCYNHLLIYWLSRDTINRVLCWTSSNKNKIFSFCFSSINCELNNNELYFQLDTYSSCILIAFCSQSVVSRV
jgi:hypothetical protein